MSFAVSIKNQNAKITHDFQSQFDLLIPDFLSGAAGKCRAIKGIVMKQRQSVIMAGYQETDEFRARWWRRLKRTVLLTLFLWLGIKALFAAPGSGWIWALGVYLIVVPCTPFVLRWFGGRQRRGWRREGLLFEPSLPRPVSDIPEEQEWTLPFHPAIRVPLALLLIALMYWVLVLHQMQVPGEWLVGTTVVTIINLWAWREPLILVLLVCVGVAILSVIGWVIEHLSWEGILAVAILVTVLATFGVMEIRKRKSR